jgi:hypothetical protein
MRNLWCLEKISILPFIISATGIVPQSLFKNLKILDLENTLVVEIQKGILLAIPAISETSGENCVQNVKADTSPCLLKWFVFFRKNEDLIEVYL